MILGPNSIASRIASAFDSCPILRSKFETPYVRGLFKLDGDLKKLPQGVRTLNPGYSRAAVEAVLAPLDLQRYPTVLLKVMLGSVPAAVEVETKSGGGLLKRFAQQIVAADDEGQRLRNALTAPSLGGRLAQIQLGTPAIAI